MYEMACERVMVSIIFLSFERQPLLAFFTGMLCKALGR